MELKVFVIVVTYKGWQWYERCFSSLAASSYPVQTIVVDNASDDGTLDYVRDNYPNFVLIGKDRNLGFGQANNIGIRYALDHGCDFVFLLNQDAWIEPDTISKLIKVSQDHNEYGILSPIHLNAEKTDVEKLLLKRIVDYHTTDSKLFEDLFFNRLKDVYDTKYVNAAAWFMTRRTLESVGGFDPVFFHYGEDDNYLNRVFYHGFKVGLCPQVTIVHDNDRPRPLYDSREKSVLMMIDYTNVNKKRDINKEKMMFLWKAVTAMMKCNKAGFRNNVWKYKFLKTNASAIINSLDANRRIQENWIK